MPVARELHVVGEERQPVVRQLDALADPSAATTSAKQAAFERVTPDYPGVRAPVPDDLYAAMLGQIEAAAANFGFQNRRFEGRVWFSIVTTPADRLTPIQRLPHVDGTDPQQLALLVYLHRTRHGGTNFYRHRATGFETLTPERWATYKERLEADIAREGLPPQHYVDDGAPHFERIWTAPPIYNSLVIYRGNALHSGAIAPDEPLSADPLVGRLTINGFFRPAP
jgi:Family of unknown function (DUF6445)